MFFVRRSNLRRNHEELKMSVIFVLILFVDLSSCLKFQCVNKDCSELITKAEALYKRPRKNYSDLSVEKGDSVDIYGMSKDVCLVKRIDSELYFTLPVKVLKLGKIKHAKLQEVDFSRDTCPIPSVLEIFNITKSCYPQLTPNRSNMSAIASNSSYENKVSSFNKSAKEFNATIKPKNGDNTFDAIEKEHFTVATRENVTDSPESSEVEVNVAGNNNVNDANAPDSNASFTKSHDLVSSGINDITEDEKLEANKILNVDIPKINAAKHANKEQKDNLTSLATNNDSIKSISSEKFKHSEKSSDVLRIEEKRKNSSKVTLLAGEDQDNSISNVANNIVLPESSVSENSQKEESSLSSRIESKKEINFSSQANASNESSGTIATQNTNTVESVASDENTSDTVTASKEKVGSAQPYRKSKILEDRVNNKLDDDAPKPPFHPESLNSITDFKMPDNLFGENSPFERRVSVQTNNAAAKINEDVGSSNENLSENMPVSNEKTVLSKTLPPFMDQTNIVQSTQEGRLKVSPPIMDQKVNVVQSKREEGLQVSPSVQMSTIGNKPDTISQKATHSPEIMTNFKEKEGNDFYDIIGKQKLDIPSLTENVEVAEQVRYLDTLLEYVFSLSIIAETYFPDLLNFKHWFPRKNFVAENEYCVPGSKCEPSGNDVTLAFDSLKLDSYSFWESWNKSLGVAVVGISSYCVLCLIILISLHSNFKTKRKLHSFISVINHLEKRLLVAKKELSSFEEKINSPGSQDTESTEKCKEVAALELQLTQFQHRNIELEDKVLYLERELENVSMSALEIHKLLENSLITQTSSKNAEDELETLRILTEKQELQIEDLIKEMDSIVTENKCLKDDLKKNEKECSAQTKKNLELAEKNRDLTVRLERQIENNTSMKSNFKSEIYQLQSKLEDTLMNLRRYEFQIQEMNRAFLDKSERKMGNESRSLDEELQLKLQISTLTAINNELTVELKEQKNARRMLDEHVGDVIKELKDLKKSYEAIEKERNEAVTKLHVLTNYFDDKEAQLHKEIEEKERLFVESESKDQLLSQKLASLHEEIHNYKARNEELKKEIQDQEGSYKLQLAATEQKARDLWFALRQAERKYQESEKEAATLRNKLLIVETNLSSANQKLNEKTNNINGDASPVPIIYRPTMSPDLLPYGAPTEIIPPPPSPIASHSPEFFPPEPSYLPDERLPPLGGRRVPSPTFLVTEEDNFRPPPPHAQYMPGRNRNEPPVPTNLLTNRLRNVHMKRRHTNSADSPSSGVSMESLDKSGR